MMVKDINCKVRVGAIKFNGVINSPRHGQKGTGMIVNEEDILHKGLFVRIIVNHDAIAQLIESIWKPVH